MAYKLITNKTAKIRRTPKPERKHKHKYNAQATFVDGIRFASKGEAARYMELKLLAEHGMITDLELQPRYELKSKATTAKGIKLRAITYVADFAYMENGVEVVEDFKGHETDMFKLKRKMFLQRYPNKELRIIKRSR